MLPGVSIRSSAYSASRSAKSGCASARRLSRAARARIMFGKQRRHCQTYTPARRRPQQNTGSLPISRKARKRGRCEAEEVFAIRKPGWSRRGFTKKKWTVPYSPLVLDLMGLQVQVGVVYPGPRSRQGQLPMSTIKAPGHRNLTRETVTVRGQVLGVRQARGNVFQLGAGGFQAMAASPSASSALPAAPGASPRSSAWSAACSPAASLVTS